MASKDHEQASTDASATSATLEAVTALTGYPRIGGAKLSDRVAVELEHRILSGEFKPGDRLPTETELGGLFGVSRSVVRDGIRTLAAQRMLEVRQGRGIVVTEVNSEAYGEALMVLLIRSGLTMRDVTEARAAIEVGLGRLAAERATPDDLGRMEQDLRAFAGAVATADWKGAHESHAQFHGALCRAANLPALEIMLAPMQRIILLSSVIPMSPKITELDDAEIWDVPAHPPILDALKNRDPDAVERAIKDHFNRFLVDEGYDTFEGASFGHATMWSRLQGPDEAS